MNYFCLIISIASLIPLCIGSDELRIKKTEFIEDFSSIIHPLPDDLANKSIVHLKTLAIQRDNFSCGYHALFNAFAIDRAMHEYYNFEFYMAKNLANKDLFAHVCTAVQQQVKQDKPLDGAEISQIADNLKLAPRLVPLFYTDQKELMIPALYAFVEHAIGMPKQEIEQLLHEKRKSLVSERISSLMRSIKNKTCPVGHFICNTGNHWMLFSLVSDWYANPKLYIIGAWNEPMNDTLKKYAYDLLSYFERAR